ncbi:MAG: hypothetical protein RL684_1571 [Pseudomonadota bacterium]
MTTSRGGWMVPALGLLLAARALAAPGDDAAIRDLEARQAAAWNAHDAAAYAALFTQQGDVVNVLGWWWQGQGSIQSQLGDAFAWVFRDSTLTVTDVQSRLLDARTAIAHVRWTLDGAKAPPGAPAPPREGIQLQVLRKLHGRWLIESFQNTNAVPERPFPKGPPAAAAAGAVAPATVAPPPAAAAPPACEAAAFHGFDFWLGDWDVHTPDGRLAGGNAITREQGGCVLHERYGTGHGYAGESLNIYDAGRARWHQTWVDNGGLLLVLEGELQAGSMVMEGQTTGADGKVTRHRITWTPNADGSVRQHWQSTDAQGQWTTAFDGRYTRR